GIPREGRAPRGDVRRDPRTGARSGAAVRRRLRRQVPEGRHDAGEGRRRAAHVLRLPRRALEAPQDLQRDRVTVRDGPAAPARDEGCGVPDEGAPDGLQAPRHGTGPVATTRWGMPPPACAGRRRVRGWRAADKLADEATRAGGRTVAAPARGPMRTA